MTRSISIMQTILSLLKEVERSLFFLAQSKTRSYQMHGLDAWVRLLQKRLLINREEQIYWLRRAVNEGMSICWVWGLMYPTCSISGYRGEQGEEDGLGIIDAGTAIMTGRLTLNCVSSAHCSGTIFPACVWEVMNSITLQYGICVRLCFAYWKRGNGITGNHDGLIINDNEFLQRIRTTSLLTETIRSDRALPSNFSAVDRLLPIYSSISAFNIAETPPFSPTVSGHVYYPFLQALLLILQIQAYWYANHQRRFVIPL